MTKLKDNISLTHRSTNKGKHCNRNLNIILVSFDAGVKPAPEFIGKGRAASKNVVTKNTDDQLIAIGFGSIKCCVSRSLVVVKDVSYHGPLIKQSGRLRDIPEDRCNP